MKSDNISISKYTESNPRTVACAEDNGLNQGNIHLKFSDGTVRLFDLTTISCINPMFFSSFDATADIEILLPKALTYSNIMDFLFVFKNGFGEFEHCPPEASKRLLTLLQISEFFQNESFSVEFIREIVLSKLTVDNSIEFLRFSYEKLSYCTSVNIETDDAWFDLFYQALEMIGKNVECFIDNITLIKQLDDKIVNELIEKMCSHLVLGNFILIENSLYANTHPIEKESSLSYEIDGENFFESMNFETKGQPLQRGLNNNLGNSNKLLRNANTVTHKNNETEQQRQGTQGLELAKEKKEINFVSMAQIESIIALLYEHKRCSNFFDRLTHEQIALYSSEALKELKECPYPTFQVKIPYDFDNFYEEYPIDLIVNNQKVIFVVYYKQNEDSFNVSIKLSDNTSTSSPLIANNPKHNLAYSEKRYSFKILSFFSIVSINNEKASINSTQTCMVSLSNKKSMNSIFAMNNFKALIKSKVLNNSNGERPIEQRNSNVIMENNGLMHLMKDSSNELLSFDSDSFFSLKVHLKLCFTHSVLASYLLKSFSSLCTDPKINKMSKQLLVLIVKSKYLNKSSEDDVVIGLLNWLNDEINIKEDITELFDVIKWTAVSDYLIFELLIKYSHMIINEDIENIFIKAFNEKEKAIKQLKGQDYVTTKDLIASFFLAAKRVKYHSVYNQMIKNSKFSLINAAIQRKEGNKHSENDEHTDSIDNNKGEVNQREEAKKQIKSASNLTFQPSNSNSQQWNGNKMVVKPTEPLNLFNQSNKHNLINLFNKQKLRLNNVKGVSDQRCRNQVVSRFFKKDKNCTKDIHAKKITNIPLKTSPTKVKMNNRPVTPIIGMKDTSSKPQASKVINSIVKQPHYEKKQPRYNTPVKTADYLHQKYNLNARSAIKPMAKLVRNKSKGDMNDGLYVHLNKNTRMNKLKSEIEMKQAGQGLNKSNYL